MGQAARKDLRYRAVVAAPVMPLEARPGILVGSLWISRSRKQYLKMANAQLKLGSSLQPRQRAKAMAVALGVVMVFTLGLLSIVSSSTDHGVAHVTRSLREYLTNQGHPGAAMEAQARRDQKPSPPLAAVMESQLRVYGTGAITPAPAKPVTDDHARSTSAMEAIPPRHEQRGDWEPVPDTVADVEAKAEKAEEIAQAALQAAIKAEERAEAAEEAAEMAIMTQVGHMVEEAQGGEQIVIVGEIEDSDDVDDSEDGKDSAKLVKGW
ncbi:hypothetical protein PR001_g28674 [Phytophthora rubi]|uniref:Uncharacterized protein n=2 Tax=Phytophthora rubi TaxID=129364 RepID=A0A6A3HA79_9STRA|nr:hypothetical protein PR001_g28674 [Phytophthora rubi]